MIKLRELILLLIAILALSAAVYGYYHPRIIQVQGDTQFVEVEVPKYYKVVTKETITVKEIQVITKTEVKEKWPAWFTNDPTKQLTAVGLVTAYKGDTECASVFSTTTGESIIVTKRLPVPMFGFENTGRIGALIGIGQEVHANWTFARAGSFYLTTGGTLIHNGNNNAYAVGIGIDKEF